MKKSMLKLSGFGLAAAILALSGCILISGTFIIVKPFSFTSHTGFYFYDIDITEEPDWKDHKDDIDDVDLVGFEMWFENFETTSVTFNVYIDGPDEPQYTSYAQVAANTHLVLADLTLPASTTTHLEYKESFKYVKNVDALKKLVKAGTFHFYGVASGGETAGYHLDKGQVIVTFSASK